MTDPNTTELTSTSSELTSNNDTSSYIYETQNDLDLDDNPSSSSRYTSSEEKKSYSKSIINVSKRVMGKHIIMNRCMCMFMIWMHVSIGLVSIFMSMSASRIASESTVCTCVWYMTHYVYGYVNIMLVIIYILILLTPLPVLFADAARNDYFVIVFLLLAAYTVLLKIISSYTCTFYYMGFVELMLYVGQYLLEAALLRMYFVYIHKKTSLIMSTLEDSIQYITVLNHPAI